MGHDDHSREIVELAIVNSGLVVHFFPSPIYKKTHQHAAIAAYWTRSFFGTGFGVGWENVDGLLVPSGTFACLWFMLPLLVRSGADLTLPRAFLTSSAVDVRVCPCGT